MNGLYRVLEKIKEVLVANIDVNTVTYGDITQVDLDKQTIYPLSHVMLNTIVSNEQVLRFNISIIAMDIVDVTKEEDDGYERSNEQDVLNTQLAVLNKLIMVLRRGTLFSDKFQLEGDPTLEPFYERFENRLAGFAATMNVIIHNDIDIC